jgi:hypothetical protein
MVFLRDAAFLVSEGLEGRSRVLPAYPSAKIHFRLLALADLDFAGCLSRAVDEGDSVAAGREEHFDPLRWW